MDEEKIESGIILKKVRIINSREKMWEGLLDVGKMHDLEWAGSEIAEEMDGSRIPICGLRMYLFYGPCGNYEANFFPAPQEKIVLIYRGGSEKIGEDYILVRKIKDLLPGDVGLWVETFELNRMMGLLDRLGVVDFNIHPIEDEIRGVKCCKLVKRKDNIYDEQKA